MTSKAHDSPNAGDIMQRGPNNPVWTVRSDSGKPLSIKEFKKSLKMPLTEKEVFTVMQSWKTISPKMKTVGCNILLRLVLSRSSTLSLLGGVMAYW